MHQKKFSENVIQNAPNYTINKHSGQYMLQYISLNIVRSNTISLIFIKMNIFTFFFFYKIVAKYTPERTKLHHFLKFSRGSMPPNPLANEWLCHALHGTKRYENRFTFLKIILNPTPPPRNETLDTPLSQIMLVNSIYPHNKYIYIYFFVVVYVS